MEFNEVIQARKSVRRFTPAPVPLDVVRRVLEAAILAPTWANMQGVRYIVVNEPAAVGAVKAAIGQAWVETAPVFVVAVSQERWSGKNKNGLAYYMLDVGICFEHVVLAATSEGLGTCWIGYFDEDAVRKALGVPDKLRVIAITPLGFPDDGTKPRTRKQLAEVASLNKHGEPFPAPP